MSERPKWMPSSEDVAEAYPVLESLYGKDVQAYCACADCLHYQTGLRAQIAAWEEMQSMFNGPSLQIVFREKIAALKKELSE